MKDITDQIYTRIGFRVWEKITYHAGSQVRGQVGNAVQNKVAFHVRDQFTNQYRWRQIINQIIESVNT
jgi:hypothetical protein